jgi:hypothetical protein
MKLLALLLLVVSGGTAQAFVVTNVGSDHEGATAFASIYEQSGDAVNIHQCAVGQEPTPSACPIVRTASATELFAAFASPGPFSSDDTPIVAEQTRSEYQALLLDDTAHNLRVNADGSDFEDPSVDPALAVPLMLTGILLQ